MSGSCGLIWIWYKNKQGAKAARMIKQKSAIHQEPHRGSVRGRDQAEWD